MSDEHGQSPYQPKEPIPTTLGPLRFAARGRCHGCDTPILWAWSYGDNRFVPVEAILNPDRVHPYHDCYHQFSRRFKPGEAVWVNGNPEPIPTVFANYGNCRSCNNPILWVRTNAGRAMPVDPVTGESHFATCPHAGKHRRGTHARRLL
jgi:hypothetical protein